MSRAFTPKSRALQNLFLAAALTLSVLAAPALAQDETPDATVQFNLLSIDGLVIGTTINVDEAFGVENEIDVPAPFSFLIPTSDDVRELLDPAPTPGEALVKVNFATQDLQLIENLQFVPYTLPLGDIDERMNTLAGLMANDAFQVAVGEHDQNTRDIVRAIKVGEYDAVEVIGRYQDANLGLMYLRLVGILNPDSEQSVFTIANVVAARQPIPTPDDFPQTRGGVALKNFHFITE